MAHLAGELGTRQTQTVTLAPQQRQGLKLLAMSLPELRAELYRELSTNPVIEEVEPTLEKSSVSDEVAALAADERRGDYPDDDTDYRDEAFLAGLDRDERMGEGIGGGRDVDAVERRDRFFANQTAEETLEQHLLAQLAFSGIAAADQPLAEILIGELDDDGRFAGSIPDLMMVSGESEAKIRGLLKRIAQLDPPGCGTTNPRDCLLAQLEKLDDSPYRQEVKTVIERHLEDVAAGREEVVEKALGIDHGRYAAVLTALRTLDPRPGRAYRRGGRGVEYVNPEVHAVKAGAGWQATVDARSLPEIRISEKYLAMLKDPHTDAETRSYVQERVAAAKAVREAVARRQETITAIAQAIFDAQGGFFTEGLKGLKPLTMEEIARKVGVHPATVSRTVRDKYASTPKGTVELRKFFLSGYTTDAGEQVSTEAVVARLQALIAAEDRSRPYADEKLSELLKAEGFTVARRTVAKYRMRLGIPGASERRVKQSRGSN